MVSFDGEFPYSHVAVRFATGFCVVFLMIFLAYPEGSEREEERVDFVTKGTELVSNGLRFAMLLLIGIENAAAVLRTMVGTDAVGLCRVMDLIEQTAKVSICHLLCVKFYQNSFNVVCSMVAHFSV